MTVTVQSATYFARPTTVAHTVSTAPNRVLLVYAVATEGFISGMTYAGQALSAIGSVNFSNVWLLVNPPTGANNFVVTYSSIYTKSGSIVCELSGVNASNPLGSFVSAQARNTPSITVPPNGLAWGGIHTNYAGDNFSANSPTVKLAGGRPSGGSGFAAGVSSATGAMSWNGGSGTVWCIGCPVNPVPAATASPPPRRRTQSNLILL